MSTRARLGAFVATLVVAFGAAAAIGAAVGPIDVGNTPVHDAPHDTLHPPTHEPGT